MIVQAGLRHSFIKVCYKHITGHSVLSGMMDFVRYALCFDACLLVIELFPRIVAASRNLNGSLLSHLPIARTKKILKKFYFLVVSSMVYVYTLIRCTKRGANVVAVAQSVVAPDCGSGGREFKSRQPPH